MIRKLLVSLALLALIGGIVLAQAVVTPTDGDDVINKINGDKVSVDQTVKVWIPKATALHLETQTLEFDLRTLDGANWENGDGDPGGMVCVYGTSATDVPVGGSVLPLGLRYDTAGWPNIKITDQTGNDNVEVINRYPPLKFDEDGEVRDETKIGFVCWRTFIVQKFTNGTDFEFSVQRTSDSSGGALDIYIQDNICSDFGANTGLYALPDVGNGAVNLLPGGLTSGPSGELAAHCPGGKVWLDDLVVLGVKFDGDEIGSDTAYDANLTYTLTTTAW